MDWSGCSLVETKAGVQHGRPVLRGTRMPADDIIENWEAGVDEPDIAENFASSGKSVGDGERQRAVSIRNRRNFLQVESKARC